MRFINLLLKNHCRFLFIFTLFVVVHAQQQIEINDFFAKVYLAPNTSSKFIGLAQKGETYPVIESRDTWYRIKFKNAVGWIQQTQTLPSSGANTNTGTASSNPANTTTTPSYSQTETTQIAENSTSTVAPRYQSTEQQPDSEKKPQTQQQSGPQKISPAKTDQTRQPPPKQPSKLRNWFNQKNFLNTAPGEIIDDTVKYFLVTMAPARVLTYLSPDAPILGMARKGELLQLIGEGDSWCKVTFADTIGWIEHKNGKIVDSPKSVLISDLIMWGVILGVLILIAVVIFIVHTVSRKKLNLQKDVTIQKNVLIIAKTSKIIEYTLTDNTTTLDRCFSEIGFNISNVRDPGSMQKTIEATDFDIILVDWKFDRNIIPMLERFYSSRPDAAKILCIVYNVPDPAAMQPGHILPMMYFLGSTFSDRDIFKMVTPLIISENAKQTQKSTQSSALEGKVGDGNLLEVLQFIEIGSKTGCLLIQTDHPYGLIYFVSGRIVYAATAEEVTGRDAIFKMLDQKNGTFRFILNRKPKTSNVNLSTLEVLMEWTKAVDEAHGH